MEVTLPKPNKLIGESFPKTANAALILRRHSLFPTLILGVVGVITWMALLDFNFRIATDGLDDSWSSALGFFLAHHFQIGKDYHFTTGPLGYFLTRGYEESLFWHKLAWEVAVKGIFAWTLIRLTRSFSSWWARIPLCGVVILFSHQTLTMPDILYFFILLVHFLLIAAYSPTPSSWEFLFNVLVITVLSLIKNTFLFYSMTAIALCSIQFLLRRQFARVIVLLTEFIGCLVILWLGLGQNPANFLLYVRGAFNVASGYAEAMAVVGLEKDLIQAGAILLMLAICLLTLWQSFHQVLRHGTGVVLIALAVFLEWKHGFVRHDHHAFSFFGFTLLIPFLLPAVFPQWNWRNPVRMICLTSVFLLSGISMELVLKHNHIGYAANPLHLVKETWRDLTRTMAIAGDPFVYQKQIQGMQKKLAESYCLPKITARVGDATVDFISYEQGIVLLNRMNWRPRPVFQSCTTNTPFLLSANAEFYRGPEAPEYVIFKLQPIDRRLPTMEDGPALVELFRNYKPVLVEKSYLLWQKKGHSQPGEDPSPQVICEKTIHLNEEVAIEDPGPRPLILSLNVHYATAGKIGRFLYKSTPLFLRIRTVAGQTYSFRFIPDMARTGFLLNPLLLTQYDALQFCGSGPGNQVASFCIETGPNDPRRYRSDISMKLETRSDLASEMDPREIQPLLYPFFRQYPREIKSACAVQQTQCEGKEVLLVPADGMLIFNVPEGTRGIRGQFGILPGAYQEGQTDGVLFRVEYTPDNEPAQVLFERHLNPLQNPCDRGIQSLAVPLPNSRQGTVQFITTNLPGKNTWWDWSFWTGIEME
jgi:hypothetical protein